MKFDYPTLKAHPSKEKAEEISKFSKDKQRTQKAFWIDSTSFSSKTKAEEVVTNLCLMTEDHLDHFD
ncbi:hypothetical protein MA16_Dca026377 [Dendrobium catenatum]|uniref:Uncharacterized protein n=1 Tax=Dendrobium catenatum TaxID=906689 RepID=A0A2I0WEL9_9ASPA|nr:hypothetical protein MA16_Dca026377 [Dendrobium catenatum]